MNPGFLGCTLVLPLLAAVQDGVQHPVDVPETGEESPQRDWGTPNILLITLDDLGIDRFPGYGVHPIEPRMPTMEALMERGVRFEQFWAMPYCSPSRASLLTGRFPSAHGIYGFIPANDIDFPDLDPSERTLPRVLPGYRSAVIGKWHLRSGHSPPTHPQLCGFDHHVGSMFNISNGGYFRWKRFVDGKFEFEERYATTVTTDDALAMANNGQEEPWFLYVNYNAPHAPFHDPPADLHSYGELNDDRTRFRAMCEALDKEIGRLLAGIDLDETLVIVLGDNGTPQPIVDKPWPNLRGKGTLYEGGVHVPLVVAGPGVVHGVSSALVSIADVHRTLVDYVGGTEHAESSVSFLPQLLDPAAEGARRYLYAETGTDKKRGAPSEKAAKRKPKARTKPHKEAIRDKRWKLIREPGGFQFYDMLDDPEERRNLLSRGDLEEEVKEAYERLLAELDRF